MRLFAVAVLLSAFAASAASAEPVRVTKLAFDARLTLDLDEPELATGALPGLRLLALSELEAVESVAEQTTAGALAQAAEHSGEAVAEEAAPKLRRVHSFQEDTRVFWYATGAAAITSLATRVLLAIPGFFVLGITLAAGSVLPPVASWVLLVGAVAGWAIIDSALSALAGSFVYDRVSKFYTSSFLPGFAGQLAGATLAGGVLWLTMGFGLMLTTGLELITPFTLQGALTTVQLFSALGVMPALVVAFLASVALPAVMGTWALAVTARPKDGYVIDRSWRPLDKPRASLSRADRDRLFVPPVLTLAFPDP